MSQVKKLQKGGTFTIDGIKYDATPEFINALTTHLRDTAGTDAQTLAGLSKALQNGQDLSYDSSSNTISGMDGVWSGITQRQNERRKTGSSNWRKFWEAQLDTDAHRFRNALSAIGSFNYQVPKEIEETPDLANIYGDQTWYEYNTDEKGNKTWLDNSSKNIGITKRLADMTDYLSDIEAGKKKYKLGEWYSPERIDALKGLYGQYSPETWNSAITAIGERAKSNSLTPEDIAFLKNFNIVDPGEVTEGTGNGMSPQDRQKWIAGGHEGLIPLLGQRAIVNDDGSISLRDGESWGWNLGELNGKNIWFNDDFYKSTYGADGTFEPLRGYTLYNNRLYALNNPALANILNADGGFNAMKRAGNWTGADNLILTRFTESNRENPAALGADAYSTFLSGNPNYRFSDLTGRYTTNGMVDGDQLIQYVDLGEDSLVGPYRNYGYKYAILDNRGNLKQKDIDSASISEIVGGSAREGGLNTYKQVVGNQGKYSNRYYEDLIDSKGNATGFRIYTDKNNSDDIILHMPEITASGTQEQDIVVPKDVASILFRDKNVWDNIIGNAQNKKNFMSIMSSLVRSHFSPNNNAWVPFVLNSTVGHQLKNLGFKDQELNDLVDAFRNARKGSKAERRENYLVNQPQFKQGGVIKEQTGGVAGGAKTSTGVTERKVNAINTNPKNSAAALGDSKNWTDADTADVTALLADLGSLGTAFVPGANIASAATGAAGSTARLYADLNRGTKGAGWNYLLNLGMDAATLIPFAGGGAHTLKVVNNVKKLLPTIIKAASVYGLGAGVVDAAKKIASGQKFTVRDVDMVVNALTAGVGLGKSGGLGRANKTSKTRAYSENFKLGNTEVKLGDAEIKSILKSSDQPKALREAIKKQVPNASDAEVANAAENLLKTKKTLWQKIRGNDGDIVLNAKKKAIKTAETTNANGNDLHDWWHGVGQYQKEYNMQLRGEPVVRQEIIMPQNTQPGLLNLSVPAVVNQTPVVKGIALPQWINPFTMANRQQNVDVQPSGAVMRPLFKKGGKIKKGQGGMKPQGDFDPELQKYLDAQLDFQNKVGDYSKYFNPDGSRKTMEMIGKVDSSILLGKAPTIATSTAPDPLQVEANNRISESITDNRNKYGTDWGQFPADKWNPDLTVPLNWARSLYAMKQSDAQLKNFLNRPQFQHQDLQLNAPRYINTGAGDAYRTQANQLRVFKPVTSDALQNDLMARDRQREALQAELQGNLADSQEFGQYKTNLDAFTNDLRMKQYNIADTNSQLRWQHAIEDIQAKNANIAEKSKFFDQAAYATQDWYNRNYQTRQQLEGSKTYTDKLKNLDDWYRNERLAIDKKNLEGDALTQKLATLNSRLALKKQELGYDNLYWNLSPIFRKGLKKGGKVESGKRSAMTYSRDPYPELLLQNAKDSTEIVKQLNDAVIKLLLQTKLINVH